MAHAAVKRELLVRYLDSWVATALHGARRATYLDGYPTGDTIEAALQVLAEFTDLPVRGRLSVVLAAPDEEAAGALTVRVAEARARLGTPRGVSTLIVPWPPGGDLPMPPAPAGSPLLAYLDAAGVSLPPPAALGQLLLGGRGDVIAVRDAAGVVHDLAGAVERYRAGLLAAGAPMVTCVEMVDRGGASEVLLFATASAKRLEAFKDALWAVDEFAGVRYRDPRDPGHALLDISLSPHPGPLRRALLGRLGSGPQTVEELRRYALTETVYRAADVPRVLTALVSSGAVSREPAHGRLTGQTRLAALR